MSTAAGAKAGPSTATTEGAASTTASKDSEAKETKKADLSVQQSMAALGIGLIAMGEDIGAQMAMRSFAHLFRYGVKWHLLIMKILLM